MSKELANATYWTDRYKNDQTGWDIGYPSTPLKTYIDQIENKEIAVLIPGAGNAYEAEYMHKTGFVNIHVIDISKAPLEALQKRCPDFPSGHLHHDDFFTHDGAYDLILEQTFFCSFPPTPKNRREYAKKMTSLLRPSGRLVGVWFDFPLVSDLDKRPYGGNKKEYLTYFEDLLTVHTFERCYNSIPPRQGNELFAIMEIDS